jgi:hypothetical protein
LGASALAAATAGSSSGPGRTRGRGHLYSAHQRRRALVNERFEVDVVDGGQGLVEEVAGDWHDGDEVSMEEDGVENGCAGNKTWASANEDRTGRGHFGPRIDKRRS